MVVELRAVVIGVDRRHRLVTLASDDGARAVLPVAEEFRDFERFHVGDQVVVSYTGNCTYSEALALAIRPDVRK